MVEKQVVPIRVPREEGVPDSHTDAVRRVLFQYLKRQTRKRTNNVPGLYLAEMRKCLDDPDRFRLNFQYWTFAARPPVSPEFAANTLKWIQRYKDDRHMLDSLVHSLEAIHKPVFSGGSPSVVQGGETIVDKFKSYLPVWNSKSSSKPNSSSKPKSSNNPKSSKPKSSNNPKSSKPKSTDPKSAIVLLTNDLKQVLINSKTNNFPFINVSVEDTHKSPHAFQGQALHKAVQIFKAQMGFSISATYRFLGERTAPSGNMMYLCQLPTASKPGQVMGKPSKWITVAKMPSGFKDPQAWAIASQFPIRVRDFAYTGSTIVQMRRVLVYSQTSKGMATTIQHLRNKDVVYVLFAPQNPDAPAKPMMNAESNFVHPVTVLPSTHPIQHYVRLLGITHLYVESCAKAAKAHGTDANLCKTLSATFPNVKLYENLAKWSLKTVKPMERVNPALTARKQGTPGFTNWLHQTYKTNWTDSAHYPLNAHPIARCIGLRNWPSFSLVHVVRQLRGS